MKEKMVFMNVLGAVLLLGGILMLLTSKESAQIGGLEMIIGALGTFMQVRFRKIERRLSALEGKPTD